MNRYLKFLLIVVVLVIAALAVAPAFAQDEAPDTPPAATLEAMPVSDTEQPPVIPANNTGSILLVVAAILTITASGGGILAMLQRFQENKSAVKATEALGDSVPRPIAEKLIEVIHVLAAGGAIAIEALDGVPAESKVSKTLNPRFPADSEDR